MFTTVAKPCATAMIGMGLKTIGRRERDNLGENPRPGPGVCNTSLSYEENMDLSCLDSQRSRAKTSKGQ